MVIALLVMTGLLADPQVTLDLPATRLPEIAKRIIEQTGEQVKITGPDPRQFVFIKVEKMPFSRLRESLSFVTGGKWTKAGEVWALQTLPPGAQRKAEIERLVAAWLEENPLKPAPSKSELQVLATAQPEEVSALKLDAKSRTPLKRLLTKILQAMPGGVLADVPPNSRVVYSLNPTTLQRALPASLIKNLKDAESESLLWLNALRQPGSKEASALHGGEWISEPSPGDRAAHLMLTATEQFGGLSFAVSVFDSQGARIGYAREELTGPSYLSPRKLDGVSPLSRFLPKGLICRLTPSDDAYTKEHYQAMANSGALPGQKANLPKLLTEKLLCMAVDEPLTWHPTSMLRQLASASKRQVVAKVVDGVFFSLQWPLRKDWTLGRAVDGAYALTMEPEPRMKIENDLICLTPSMLALGGGSIADRPTAVEAFKRSLAGAPLLDTMLMAALREPNYSDFYIHDLAAGLPLSNGNSMVLESTHYLLRLYGSLSENQREAVSQGRLTLADLTGPQASEFARLACSNTEARVDDAPGAKPPLTDLERDPTVLFALTKPELIRLQIVRRSQPALLGLTDKKRYDSPVDRFELAWRIWSRENGSVGNSPPAFYAKALRDELSLSVRIGSRGVFSASGGFYSVLEPEKLLTYSQLPKEFRDEVSEAIASLRGNGEPPAAPVKKGP